MIAPEGRVPVAMLLVGACGVVYLGAVAWSLPLWGLAAVAAWVFRAPRVSLTQRPLAIVSPARGRIVAIDRVEDPWLGRPALRIAIGLPFPGVGVIYSPVGGKVMDYWTDLGPVRAASPGEGGAPHEAFSELARSPTQYTLAIETDAGDEVVLSVSSRSSRSRLKFDNSPGERVSRGHRSGFVYLANRVEVLVPVRCRQEVAVGTRVVGGAEIIATLVRR